MDTVMSFPLGLWLFNPLYLTRYFFCYISYLRVERCCNPRMFSKMMVLLCIGTYVWVSVLFININHNKQSSISFYRHYIYVSYMETKRNKNLELENSKIYFKDNKFLRTSNCQRVCGKKYLIMNSRT